MRSRGPVVGFGVGIALAALALLAPAAGATLTYATSWWTGNDSIWAAHNDGSSRHLLFESSPGLVAGSQSHVSPNGRLVVFDRPQTAGGPRWMTLIAATGGLSRPLAQDAMFLAWSPDSRTIAAAVFLPEGRQQERLMLIDVASGAVRPLIEVPDIKGASFSPRGDRLVYAAGAGLSSEIFTIPVAGGELPTNIGDGHRAQWPVWGTSWIAYTRWREVTRRPALALVKSSGTLVREITHAHYPRIQPMAWSANGTRLLLNVSRPTDYAATYDLRTGKLRPIGRASSQNGGHGAFPYAISRDGTTVLGTSGSLAKVGGLNVVTLPFGGGKLHVLVRHATYPSWSR
jgi:hypothetical protein